MNNKKLYKRWTGMKQRCSNPNYPSYKNYGGRGISVCEEWTNSFEAFRKWCISNGYAEELTIDRINNDGNYEPNNCRFATRKTQAANRRKLISSNSTGYRGVTKQQGKYKAQVQKNSKLIYLGMFNDAIDAARKYDSYVIENKLGYAINFNML